jgi:DNA-repair protein complementing XP-A cells
MSSAPASVRNASSTSTQAAALTTPAADAEILRPAKNLGKYIDYDFSTMVDTKGGFLSATDDPDNKALHAGSRVEDPAEGKPAGMTMEEWERHQLLQKLRATRSGPFEPGLSVLDEEGSRKTCRECGGLEVDWIWIDIFGCAVCKKCKEKFPEKYSLLTKTEAREDYLLTNRKTFFVSVGHTKLT